ncbi:MAG: hypothetical protein KIT25_00595 [Enhydrobacter sp.]|nr:MAG: hypothetical protein KIT25_00595 [Enhydrobacter sp.]
MPGPASSFVARTARLLLGASEEPALWAISVRGRVVGSLAVDRGQWRLSWFADADPRLTGFVGPVGGDIEALSMALAIRLGAPVDIESLAV